MTNLLDEVSAILLLESRQFKFRTPLAQQRQPQNPLLDVMIPFLELQAARDDFPGKQARRFRLGDG